MTVLPQTRLVTAAAGILLAAALCSPAAAERYRECCVVAPEQLAANLAGGGAALGNPKPSVVGAYISLGYWDEEDIEVTFSTLASLGVNMVIDYALTLPEDKYWDYPFQAYLDRARAYGIGVCYPLCFELEGMTPAEADEYFARVLATVRKLKHQPAITAWYVHDEVLPSTCGFDGSRRYSITLEQMQRLYRLIGAEDPGRPQVSVWNYLPTYDRFHVVVACNGHLPEPRPTWADDPYLYEQAMRRLVGETCDIVMIDSYPVGNPHYGIDEPPEDTVAALAARAAALRRPDQPLYIVFQAFSWAQYTPDLAPGAPFPTQAELRRMLQAARRHGASGAIGYSWFDLAEPGPEQDIPGCATALANLKLTLYNLALTGWPVEQ